MQEGQSHRSFCIQRKLPITNSSGVQLQARTWPPAFLVIRLDRAKMPRLEGLEDGEIPIESTEHKSTVELTDGDQERRRMGKIVKRR